LVAPSPPPQTSRSGELWEAAVAEVGIATLRCYAPAGADDAAAATSPAPGTADAAPSPAPAAGTVPAANAPKRNAVRPGGRRGPQVPEPTPVRVLADDPVTRDAALACLLARREVRVLAPDEAHAARVVLVLVERVTGETVEWMQEAAEAAPDGVGFVVVGDGMREHHLLGAVAYGPVSVLARRDADFDRIVHAIAGVPEGRLELPEEAVGWLVGRLRTIHRDVLEPRGLTGVGLEVREVGVIRLLAEGLDTAEIAKRMNYSERTVKSIIHGVLTQRQLRNRAHAVAFALRAGVV
jgi:DNA-binding NarL/FixJ family response regulator